MTIKEALQKLDPENNAHWTADGVPLVSVVQQLTGIDDLTRAQITDADPEFCRDKAPVFNKEQDKPVMPSQEAPTLKDLDREINELTIRRDEVQKKIDWLMRQRDREQEQQFALDSPKNDTEGRIRYIRRQNELRMARHKRSQQILGGLKPEDVSTKAPLDQAMARKTGRGTDRPVRPLSAPNTEE